MNHEANPYAAPTSDLLPDATSREGTEVASRLKRLGAVVLDLVILGGSQILTLFLIGLVIGRNLIGEAFSTAESEELEWFATNLLDGSVYLGLAIDAAVFLIINGYLLATRGQSIGKLFMNIAIVSEDTRQVQPIGKLLILRYFPIYALQVVMYFLYSLVFILDALFIFRDDRRTFHDIMAGTTVIDLKNRNRLRKDQSGRLEDDAYRGSTSDGTNPVD
ncbi:MAG: RDD family protein [Gammaproteobacteria bacterium]|nr:RDD family protein [Gammaproteobacteria bacterium]